LTAMSLDRVKEIILSSAREKAEKILGETKSEVEDKLTSFKKRLEEEYNAKLLREKKEIEEEADRIRATEIMKLEKEKLVKKREILDAFFEELKQSIRSHKEFYFDLMCKLLTRDLVAHSTVFLSRNDMEMKDKIYHFIVEVLGMEDAKISNDFIGISGGFIIKTPDFEIDDSLDTLIAEFREKHEIEIAKELFADV